MRLFAGLLLSLSLFATAAQADDCVVANRFHLNLKDGYCLNVRSMFREIDPWEGEQVSWAGFVTADGNSYAFFVFPGKGNPNFNVYTNIVDTVSSTPADVAHYARWIQAQPGVTTYAPFTDASGLCKVQAALNGTYGQVACPAPAVFHEAN